MQISIYSYRLFSQLALLLIVSFCSLETNAQLKGSYTISGNSTASASNYKSLDALFSDLQYGTRTDGGSTNGPGIGAEIVVKVDTGIFYESLSIGTINGVSSTQKIKIIGKGSTKSHITSLATSNQPTISLSYGADYIEFDSLMISNSSNPYVANTVTVTDAEHVSFSNCVIVARENPNYYTGRLLGGNRCASTNAAAYITFDHCELIDTGGVCMFNQRMDYITVRNCTMRATPYKPHYLFVWSSFAPVAQTHTACYFSGGQDVVFEGNTIIMDDIANHEVAPYELGFYSCKTVNRQMVIRNNRLVNEGGGFTIQNCSGTSSNPILLEGNEIINYGAGNDQAPLKITSSTYGKIYHNSLYRGQDSRNTSTLGGPLYLQNSKHWDIKNNLLISSGTKPCMSLENCDTIFQDYNQFWNEDYNTSSTLRIDNITIGADSIIHGTYAGLNSYYANPQLDDNRNLQPTTSCYIGDSLGNKTDRTNASRNSYPAIGALVPKTSFSTDIGVTAIHNPTSNPTNSKQSIEISITNFGSKTIDSLTIFYNLKSSTIKENVILKTPLKPCSNAKFTFGTSASFSGCSLLKVWTTSPNGTTDLNTSNDTNYKWIGIPIPSGTYSVGSSSSDYKSLADALDALHCSGLKGDGAVTFEIETGVYNERLALLPIKNQDSISRIIFKSKTGNPTDVTLISRTKKIVEKNASFVFERSLLSIITLGGMNHIDFKGIGFEAKDSAWNEVIFFQDNTKDVTFKQCKFDIPEPPLVYQVNSLVSHKNNVSISRVVLDSCTLIGGYRQVYFNRLTVTDSFVIKNCSLVPRLRTRNLMELNNTYHLRISNNFLGDRTIPYNHAIYSLSDNQDITVSNNIIHGHNIEAGIRITGFNVNIINNMISATFNQQTIAGYGIYGFGLSDSKIYHNSITLKELSRPQNPRQLAALRLTSQLGSNVEIHNNIFKVHGAGDTIHCGVQDDSYSNTPTLDYNIYSSNTVDHRKYNTPYKAGSTITGTNSKATNPNFINFWNLHFPSGKCSGVAGKTLPTVKDDIDGDKRIFYHIGADEVDTTTKDYNLVSHEIISPDAIVPHLSNKNITLSFTNYGRFAIDSFHYTVQAIDTTYRRTKKYGFKLKACASDTVTVKHHFDSLGSFDLTTITSNIDGKKDEDPTNDTLSLAIQVDQMNDASVREVYLNYTGFRNDTLSFGKDTLRVTAFVENPLKYPLYKRFQVFGVIKDSRTGKEIWRDQAWIDTLKGYASKLITFKNFYASVPGNHQLLCYVNYPGDLYPTNDTVKHSVYVEVNNDVQLQQIFAPTPNSTIEEDTSFFPSVIIRNNGVNDQTIVFSVDLKISHNGKTVYNSTQKVTSLKAFDSTLVQFSDKFSPNGSGIYTITSTVTSLLDDYSSNNTLSGSFVVNRSIDLEVAEIIKPINNTILLNGDSLKPSVNLKNAGQRNIKKAWVYCSITNDISQIVYQDSTTIDLSTNTDKTIEFRSFKPIANGEYTAVFYSSYTADRYLQNDTLRTTLNVKYDRDVAVSSISAPTENQVIPIDQTLFPVKVSVLNTGNSSLTSFFYTRVIVSRNDKTIYRDSTIVSSLASGSIKSLNFDGFMPYIPGNYSIKAYTSLWQDEDFKNDTVSFDFFVKGKMDVAPINFISIDSTKKYLQYADILKLDASIQNLGTNFPLDSASVTMEILKNGNSVLQKTQKVIIDSNNLTEVYFGDFIPQESGKYEVECFTSLTKDGYRLNDTIRSNFTSILNYDMSPTRFVKPVENGSYTQNVSQPFEVEIANYGDSSLPTLVTIELSKIGQSGTIWTDNKTVNVNAKDNQLVSFGSYTLSDTGNYSAYVTTELADDQNAKNNDLTINFSVSALGKIEELSQHRVLLYPNPTKGSAVLSFLNAAISEIDETEIRLFDVTGRVLWAKKISNISTTIDLKDVSTGTYYLEIRRKELMTTLPIIKK